LALRPSVVSAMPHQVEVLDASGRELGLQEPARVEQIVGSYAKSYGGCLVRALSAESALYLRLQSIDWEGQIGLVWAPIGAADDAPSNLMFVLWADARGAPGLDASA
jgi:hypothetical protein